MAQDTHSKIVQVFTQVFQNKGFTPPPLNSETVLDGSMGLESLDFAEVVVRLEDVFGTDPFANGVPAGVRTLGDLSRLYE